MTKSTQFKKGDKLRVIDDAGVSYKLRRGDIVTAASDTQARWDGDKIDIEKDGKTEEYKGFYTRRFELAENVVNGLRVGDTVKIIKGGYGVSSDEIGKITTITEVGVDGACVPGAYFNSYTIAVDGTAFAPNGYPNKASIACNPATVEKVEAIDFTKPVFTAEGTPVEILTTNGRDTAFPVLAYEGKATTASKFTKHGISSLGVARRNLTNVAPKVETELVEFLNVYKRGDSLYIGGTYETRSGADRMASPGRLSCIKRVTKLVEGQFDN